MMQKFFVLAIFLFLNYQGIAQPAYFDFTTKENRDTIKARLTRMVDETLAQPFSKNNLQQYQSAFWAMELMLYKPAGMQQTISQQISLLPLQPSAYQRAFMEMLYTLYQQLFVKEIEQIWQKIDHPKVQAMCLEYLKTGGTKPVVEKKYKELPLHLQLYQDGLVAEEILPQQDDFLANDFLPGQVVVCSFQYHDRNIPGYLMIRKADHTWLKDSAGANFQVPQLARAINNLPYYLTNGNTPQGLYKLNGFDSSSIDWIGPTTNLQMVLPFEKADKPFFSDTINRGKQYEQLLPTGFKQYKPLWQSFWAGKIGRSEIIAHGTTIDPSFYKKSAYFPNTPSMGCLCSPELWNDDGIRTYSAQQNWITALKSIGGGHKGYLVVVELK
jgi:hypothetical protein